MSSTRDQADGASSTRMPLIHGVSQTYIDGYADYKINIRFNLNFPDGVKLGPDGLPRNCILVFGPNAFPATFGTDGNSIEKFRIEWSHFDIHYFRLSTEEELITGGLQMVFWINHRYRHGPVGIQSTEADLLHGLRRWAQFRMIKNDNRFPHPQLMLIDEYLRTHPHEFIAPRPIQTDPPPPSSSRVASPGYSPPAAPRLNQSRPRSSDTLRSIRPRSSSHFAPRMAKQEEDQDLITSSPRRASRFDPYRNEPRRAYNREDVQGSSRVRRCSLYPEQRFSAPAWREEEYRERSYSPGIRTSRRRSRSPFISQRSRHADIPRSRIHSGVHRRESMKYRSRSPRSY